MTKLNDKRLMAVLGKANHRFMWYCGAYPYKLTTDPKACSKRWWEALATAVSKYDFTIGEVIKIIKEGEGYSLERSALKAYEPTAIKRWGLDK
jgi:hypothetical protein